MKTVLIFSISIFLCTLFLDAKSQANKDVFYMPVSISLELDTIDNQELLQENFQASTQRFILEPFIHSGKSASSIVAFLAPGSINPSFTISNIDAQLGGSPHDRYVDQVTISYENRDGIPHHYGTFRGDEVANIKVQIADEVRTITVSLQNGYNNTYTDTLSISNSTIYFYKPKL